MSWQPIRDLPLLIGMTKTSLSSLTQTLPCSLRQYVFDDINRDQAFQIFAGANEAYNEVWWFYCSANSTAIDRYDSTVGVGRIGETERQPGVS